MSPPDVSLSRSSGLSRDAPWAVRMNHGLAGKRGETRPCWGDREVGGTGRWGRAAEPPEGAGAVLEAAACGMPGANFGGGMGRAPRSRAPHAAGPERSAEPEPSSPSCLPQPGGTEARAEGKNSTAPLPGARLRGQGFPEQGGAGDAAPARAPAAPGARAIPAAPCGNRGSSGPSQPRPALSSCRCQCRLFLPYRAHGGMGKASRMGSPVAIPGPSHFSSEKGPFKMNQQGYSTPGW